MNVLQIAELAYNAGASVFPKPVAPEAAEKPAKGKAAKGADVPAEEPAPVVRGALFSDLTESEQFRVVARVRLFTKGLASNAKEAYDLRTITAITEPKADGTDADAQTRAERAASRLSFELLPEAEQIARSIFAGVALSLLPFLKETV